MTRCRLYRCDVGVVRHEWDHNDFIVQFDTEDDATLAFDGHTFSMMTWLAVCADDKTTRSGEDGFRDRLCVQIAKIVRKADFVNKVLTITFEDGSTIRAFARDEDYRQPCPEALLFKSYKFKTLYVI